MDGEKKGFTSVGYVNNLYEYVKEISNLASTQINTYDLNELIDKQRDEKTCLCFDKDRNQVASTENCIRHIVFDTGYVVKDSVEKIYGGFKVNSPSDISFLPGKWQGVDIGTLESILNPATNLHTSSATSSMVSFDKFSFVLDNYQSATATLNALTGENFPPSKCKELIRDAFSHACKTNQVENRSRWNDSGAIAYFPLSRDSADGQKIFVYMDRNNRVNSQKWYGAYVAKEEQLKEEIYNKIYGRGTGRFLFRGGNEVNSFLDALANKAMKEVWKFADEEKNKCSQPILRSYIVYTHYKLMSEDKAIHEEESKKIREHKGKVYFNTGLLDRHFRQLFIVGIKKIICVDDLALGKLEWDTIEDARIYSENDPDIARDFNAATLPKMASYFTKREQIIFDAEQEIKLSDQHIFRDGIYRGRIPLYKDDFEKCKGNEEELEALIYKISGEFDNAVKRATLMAKRNYKLAVPQFWRETGEIQFLLPIYLGEKEDIAKPQCALVLKFDEVGLNPHYRGATILELDEAYNNARLIAKPDVFWLNELIGNS